MEKKYFRDYGHNYLILDSSEDFSGIIRMINCNNVEGLIKCSERNINGKSYMYYDITSQISFSTMYSDRVVGYEAVLGLFEGIRKICNEIDNYFLPEERILVSPEYLYTDAHGNGVKAIYYCGQEVPDEGILTLLEFLTEHVESDNRKLADTVYCLYQEAEKGAFSLEEACRMLYDINPLPGVDTVQETNIADTEDTDFSEQDEEKRRIQINENREEYVSRLVDEYYDEPEDEPKEKNVTLPYIIMTVVPLIGIATLAVLYNIFELSKEELLSLIGAAVILLIIGVYGVIKIIKRRKGLLAVAEDEELKLQTQDEFAGVRRISLSEIEDHKSYAIYSLSHGQEKEMSQDNGGEIYEDSRTVYLEPSNEPEYKLYATDENNKCHIEMKKFPITVGKMKGIVDCAIDDSSISRIHAKIDKQGEKILLTDLNSTNGTYKNGFKMNPNEVLAIEPGDEIRFGRLNYCFR